MKLNQIVTSAVFGLIVLGSASSGFAQTATQKLFFEGDMVNGHGVGPLCVLQNQYKQGQTVVWRVRVRDQTGKQLDAKDLKSVMVVLRDGQKFPMRYGPHPKDRTDDYFWTSSWQVPATYPTGTFAYKVVATSLDGQSHDWAPFNVDSSELTIIK